MNALHAILSALVLAMLFLVLIQTRTLSRSFARERQWKAMVDDLTAQLNASATQLNTSTSVLERLTAACRDTEGRTARPIRGHAAEDSHPVTPQNKTSLPHPTGRSAE